MRFLDLQTEDYGDDTPENLVPYRSRNQGNRLTLSPYSNDWDFPAGFKDVDVLLRPVDKRIEAGNYTVEAVPTDKLLATQYWLDELGGGDPVFDELEDYPVVAKLTDGYYHIIDGHHRCDRAVGAKAPTIKAYVFDLTQVDEEYEMVEAEIANEFEAFNKPKKEVNFRINAEQTDPLAKKLQVEFERGAEFLEAEKMIKRMYSARESLFDDFDYDYIHEAAAGLVTLEAEYEGNLGLMEIVQFYEVATPEQIDLLKRLIAAHRDKEAWQLIQKVTGTHLDSGDLYEGVGLIRKGSNVTPDVGEAQTRIEAEKLGFKTTDDGVPPTLKTNGKSK